MTLATLYAKLEPIILELNQTSERLDTSEENRAIHCSTAILGTFMGMLLDAKGGDVQPLIDLVFAVGTHLGAIPQDQEEEITH